MPVHKKTKRINFMKLSKLFLTVFLVYIGIALLFPNIALFNRYQHYIIVTPSMEPTINVGDVVIINQKVDIDTLSPGDIIAANVTINSQDIIVVHYVHSIDNTSEDRIIRTRPENTLDADEWELTDVDINGIYMFKIPKIGRFLLFAQSPLGRVVILLDLIIIYFIYKMFFKKSNT